ncbi:leucyl aminopeptidase [Homoserinimonas sp. OAct 916]|uniref:leucyl aminopeptidase n=1 Tax=Homoserinimonas sp. OAct 916 TaxID=2211450 RepID=UPI000DBE2F51|nr:leucyl aminopeptidase [Homoserinimonas sp. OAct 916]
MTLPQLSISPLPAIDSDSDVLVIGVRSTNNESVLYAEGDFAAVQEQLGVLAVSAAPDALTRLPALAGSASSIAVIGLGSGSPTAATLRHAAGSAVRQLAGVKHVSFGFPLGDDDEVQAVLEGAALGAYAFTAFKSASADSVKPVVEQLTVHASTSDSVTMIARATALARSVRLVKDLVNTPPAELYPESFAKIAVDETIDLPLSVKVWDENELEADGFGGILGVGKGSSRLPRLVKLSYTPEGATSHLALVGKGITFDTGGLSLKPPASMVGMKYDMAGAATVLGTILAAARLALPVRLTAWLCLAENMPSGTATRPNDVLRIRGGRTVEVLNTDAEGRLVLADGLIAAGEESPDAIIDVATLTGAQVVALGNRYSGLMGDDELVNRVRDAAGRAGELVWPMPLPEELRALLKSEVADIANAKIGNSAAGMLLAGVFLKEFGTPVDGSNPQESIPWAHLDIAGPADNSSAPYGFTGPGGTAVMVRTLLAVAEDFSRP